MNQKLERFDQTAINWMRRHSDKFARFALFVIFFYFGFLKIVGLSPAGSLVIDLLQNTFLHPLSPSQFLIWFGAFECFIGLLILIPKLGRITFAILAFHLITTAMPLAILPDATWTQFAVPTLIGQYIIKNIALFALSLFLFARLRPMTKTHRVMGENEL